MTVDEARALMPKTQGGYVIGLPWLPEKQIREMEPKWREWCKQVPKSLWYQFCPWLKTWPEVKKLRGL